MGVDAFFSILYLRGPVDRVPVADALAAPEFRHERLRRNGLAVAASLTLASGHGNRLTVQ